MRPYKCTDVSQRLYVQVDLVGQGALALVKCVTFGRSPSQSNQENAPYCTFRSFSGLFVNALQEVMKRFDQRGKARDAMLQPLHCTDKLLQVRTARRLLHFE